MRYACDAMDVPTDNPPVKMSQPREGEVRTRFAPSPSGHLHVGGARTALFNWAYAKRHGGSFILRIEDTDVKRSFEAASVGFLENLRWLGIAWDEGPVLDDLGGGAYGPYFASQRLDVYHLYIEQLINAGRAYRAFETAEQLQAKRAQARAENRNYMYDRAALKLDRETADRYAAEARPYVVRFLTPDEGDAIVRDEVLGEVRTPTTEMDDFVILKADGYPTYHFAVVVDDALMGVTHVIRGQEHLNNSARHVLLQDALGFDRPVYAHLPLIFNPDGSKMSKRDKDKALRAEVRERGITEPPTHADGAHVIDPDTWSSWLENKDHQLDLEALERLANHLHVHLPEINVHDFRRNGYLPDVLVNYLALLGWSPGQDIEKFDQDFLVERFSLDRVQKSAAKFDREKLLAFNLNAIQDMPVEQFVEKVREHSRRYHPAFLDAMSEQQFRLFAEANQVRSKTLEDPFSSCRFFIVADEAIEYEDSKAVRKALQKGEPNGYAHLEGVLAVLKRLDDWSVEALKAAVEGYAEQHADGKLGKVAQPLRVAVTGGPISPAIFETLAILGRDSTINRIERCLAQRESVQT